MWGTVIVDAYEDGERVEVAEALEEICSPKDDYAFASGGVYCFWDMDRRRPLYIGRAVDLPDRFRTHNGMKGRSTKGNKQVEIQKFFAAKDGPLGFSVLVRSSVSQNEVGRRRTQLARELSRIADWVEEPSGIDTRVELEIAAAEGTAIRSFWLEHGALPTWNKVHGESTRWNRSMKKHYSTGDLFCCVIDSLLQSRCTLRELAAEPTSAEYEMELHSARMWAVGIGQLANLQLSDHDVLTMLDEVSQRGGGLHSERIRQDRYLLRRPWVSNANLQPLQVRQREAWTQGLPIPKSPPAPPLRHADEMP